LEYYRDPKNRIQADFAFRLGIIARPYSGLSLPENENFSSTLDVCILQNLLTNCVTLLDAMSKNERKGCYLTADIASTELWGLNPEMVQFNTFRARPLTAAVVLRHIRNALSHPTSLDPEETFPSAGYTTIPDRSGRIQQYCFVSSPDVKENRPKTFPTEEKARAYLRNESGDMPEDITIITDNIGGLSLGRNGNPFARVFKIHLTSREIHELVMGLSNDLAQPIQDSWDGSTIAKLVA